MADHLSKPPLRDLRPFLPQPRHSDPTPLPRPPTSTRDRSCPAVPGSDGEDGSSSMASFSMRDDASEVGSVASGFSSVSTGQAGGRYGSSTTYHGRGTAPLRRAASVSSRRSAAGSARGGLEQRPPPLVTTHHGGFGSGAPGGSAGGGGQHVALTAQVRARPIIFFWRQKGKVLVKRGCG